MGENLISKMLDNKWICIYYPFAKGELMFCIYHPFAKGEWLQEIF